MGDTAQEEVHGSAERGGGTGSIDRRRLLQSAGVATVAAGGMWVAPSVFGASTAFAAGSTNCVCTETTSAQLLTQQADTTPNPLPTACSVPTAGATATLATFCRTVPGQAVYLWGSGSLSTGTNGPLFDDIGVVTVTENISGGVTRYGNIYRFQSYCRQGFYVPTTLDGTYSASVQRVYTGVDANTWDYLPPQPASNPAETATPTSWWNASQPGTPNTQSTGNPGYTTATPWPGPIDISYLFGSDCGSFTVTVENRNRYQQYKWSNIFVGTVHP